MNQGQEDLLTAHAAIEGLEKFKERIQMFGAQLENLERRTQSIAAEIKSIDMFRDLEDLRRRVTALETITRGSSDPKETVGGPPGE